MVDVLVAAGCRCSFWPEQLAHWELRLIAALDGSRYASRHGLFFGYGQNDPFEAAIGAHALGGSGEVPVPGLSPQGGER